MSMKVIRVYNNNVLSVIKDDEEAIVTGKGIGFGKHAGDNIDEAKVEKVYVFKDQQKQQLYELLNSVPAIYFKISEAISVRAAKELNARISNQILISLSDHLYYAVERKKRGEQIINLMLSEIRTIYKKEYKIGLWALRLIEANLHVRLEEDEAGYIAMHIVNALMDIPHKQTSQILRYVKDMQRIIESHVPREIDHQGLDYSRLLIHLKYLAQHIFSGETRKMEDMDHLYDTFLHAHPAMQPCIAEICETTVQSYHYHLEKYEVVYLMIHISKLLHETASA